MVRVIISSSSWASSSLLNEIRWRIFVLSRFVRRWENCRMHLFISSRCLCDEVIRGFTVHQRVVAVERRRLIQEMLSRTADALHDSHIPARRYILHSQTGELCLGWLDACCLLRGNNWVIVRRDRFRTLSRKRTGSVQSIVWWTWDFEWCDQQQRVASRAGHHNRGCLERFGLSDLHLVPFAYESSAGFSWEDAQPSGSVIKEMLILACCASMTLRSREHRLGSLSTHWWFFKLDGSLYFFNVLHVEQMSIWLFGCCWALCFFLALDACNSYFLDPAIQGCCTHDWSVDHKNRWNCPEYYPFLYNI